MRNSAVVEQRVTQNKALSLLDGASIFGGLFMLYRLRNNVLAFMDKEKNVSAFHCVRSGFLTDVSFATVLTHEAQELSVIVKKIDELGGGGVTIPASLDRLSASIEDTLKYLEESGFIISGGTEEELNEKEIPGYHNDR